MDRRVALKWISSAAASMPLIGSGQDASSDSAKAPGGKGYGPDPDLQRVYQPGDLWPLTFSDAQRATMIVLCDLIMPTDDTSPSASSLGVHDFVDEWISSPYPGQKTDRNAILKGLDWLDEEAGRQGEKDFVSLDGNAQFAICRDLSILAKKDRKAFPGSFFRRLRDLIAGGYYTTPEGMKDLGYRGNVAVAEWTGPPPEVLAKLGLEPQA
ncbi:MAG: gluconate 2-dehydrogenase subunit 3 family protein [Verrucomicrobiae bacterium]|nr:gluconate 2-dehydrogenase subunit 3 family protein [Verrucomicrobiae bacterium]